VNTAVALFEGLVHQCQADLSSLDPAAADYTEQLNSGLAAWNQVFQARLSVDPPSGSQTTGHVSFNVVGGVAGAMVGSAGEPAPATSTSGVTIRAGIGAVRIRDGSIQPLGNIEPGYEFQATPNVSLFSEDAWKLMA